MMFNKNLSIFGLASALLLSTTAFAEEDVQVQQKSLLEKLDSLNAAVLGLKINGTAKAGVLTSMSNSDMYHADSPTQESQAFSDANLVFTARPSAETEIRAELRLHKDWQSAYDENNNPVIGHWFSYDGKILNKHVDFNLGYMRVGYTPYTLYTPQQLLLQEPEVFAQKRVEALAQRNLDTTSARLMQGLNVDYHSGQVGPLSDIHAQVTGARMRNAAKKADQVFFDFDYADRYFYGLRAGAEAFGAKLGVNYTDVFDRQLGIRTRLQDGDTVSIEDNSVLSVELGFDSKTLLPSLPFTVGLNGEFAMSSWANEREFLIHADKKKYAVMPTEIEGDSATYIQVQTSYETVAKQEKVADNSGTAFYVQPYATVDLAGIKSDLKVTYVQNDKDFWSEMASSPVYRGSATILNANAFYSNDVYTNLVNNFGMSSLENMYFAVYNSNPLNASNLLSTESKNALSSEGENKSYLYSRLYNNYKNAHFYRNGYKADVMKRYEIQKALLNMDPSSNMEMPYGLSTPDRSGLMMNLNFSWNDALEVNAVFAMMNESAADSYDDNGVAVLDANGDNVQESNDYMRYGIGLSLDIGRFIPVLERKIKMQLSYDHTEESAFLKRATNRMMAGLSLDIYGPVSLIGGFHSSAKEFGKPLVIGDARIYKTEETLLLAGPRVKIAPNSYVSVQYGMLGDKLTLGSLVPGMPNDELSIDKNVIIADVTVNF